MIGDLAQEISRIQDKRKNNSIEESDIIHNKTNFYNNESEDSNVLDMKAYYESNFNHNSLVGYEDVNGSKKNKELNNLNLIKNKNVHNKESNHDYLTTNPKAFLNLNNKNSSNKNSNNKYSNKVESRNQKFKKWDNSKALLYPLTTHKKKVEYTQPSSFSGSRSISRSISNENIDDAVYSRSNSNNQLSKEEIEEIKNAKKSYKENFLKSNNINDPNFIPGKRLYEQYQKKKPQKDEHHNQIKQSRILNETREATFSPSIDNNSKKIFKRSQEKNKNKNNSYYSSNNNLNEKDNDDSLSNKNSKNISSYLDKMNISKIKDTTKKIYIFEKVENRLIDYGTNSKHRLMQEKTKNSIQAANYSFHPSINEKSQIIASIKKRERVEKAKSFILNNTQDEDISDNYSEENISNDNEELSNHGNNCHKKSKKLKHNNYKKSKNINYSSNDSLMNSQENFSYEKNKIKNNSKNIQITKRTNQSNVESENTFSNMRTSPKTRKDKNNNNDRSNTKSKNLEDLSARNISGNSKNKILDKNFYKGKAMKNKIYKNVIFSKSKSKDKSVSKYIPLDKNNRNNDLFADNLSSITNRSRLEKDPINNNISSKTPNKTLRKAFYRYKFFLILKRCW